MSAIPLDPAPAPLTLHLPDEAATRRFGEDLVLALQRGDVVALSGDLGAGKSTLARAMIRTLADDPEHEVPSPTYTLVQIYETVPPVAHFDLYRLSDPREIEELGFEEAADDGIVICEWPERVPSVLAGASLSLRIETEGDGRRVAVTGAADAMARLSRSLAARVFLDDAEPRATDRRRFFGDASPRRYETVRQGGTTAILMDAPRQSDGPPVRNGLTYRDVAHIAKDVSPFVAIATALRSKGFVAPEIHAADLDQGFVLLSHLGLDTMLDAAGRPLPERYEAAALTLAALHREAWPADMPVRGDVLHTVPDFDRGAMGIEVELLLEWYVPRMLRRPPTPAERAEFLEVWSGLFDALREAETSLLLRDYHSPNVIWRGEREGIDRIGILDFQDAMMGPAAYDLASLAQDARVDVASELEMRLVSAYVAARKAQGAFDAYGFERDYAIMAVQRSSKILGLFVRLDERDGKPQYLRHIPRLKTYLTRTLGHPSLAALRTLYAGWHLLDESEAPRPR